MKPIFLEMRHLRTLIALKESGSLSLAAQRIHLTQSALSHQINAIESHFELKICERKPSFRFTPAGERLLKLAYEILPQVMDAERELVQITQGETGELRISIECHTCFDWLMPAMNNFRQKWGLVELDIVAGFHTDPVGLLLSDRSDWAVVSDNTPTEGIIYNPLFSYEMVGVCSAEHPLAEKEIWEAEDFKDETWITYPVPDEMLDLYRKVLKPAGINPKRRTSEVTFAMILLISSKRGIATLPYWAVQPYLERDYGIVARKITKDGLYSNLYGAMREKDSHKAYIRDFEDTVKTQSFATLQGLSVLTA